MKRALSFILAMVLLIGLMPMQVFAAEGTEPSEAVELTEVTEKIAIMNIVDVEETITVYVSNSAGNNSNSGTSPEAPVASMSTAYRLLNDLMTKAGLVDDPTATGRIVLTGDVSFVTSSGPTPQEMDSHIYTIVVSGITPDVRLLIKNDYIHLGPTVYENITIAKASDSGNHTLFRAEGYPLTIGQNVATVPNSSGYYFTVVGGNISGEYTGDSNLTIQSGTWRNVYAGCYQGKMTGNSTLKITGGTVDTTVSLTYGGTHVGNYDLTIQGAQVNKIRGGSSMSYGHVTGDVSVSISDGSVVNGELLAGGASGVTGNILLELTDSAAHGMISTNCTESAVVELTASEGKNLTLGRGVLKASRFTGGGTLLLGDSMQLELEKVTGKTQLQIDGSIFNSIAYIIAPEETPDDAFAYDGTEVLSASIIDGKKVWSFAGGTDPAELRLTAPEGVTLTLLQDFSGSAVTDADMILTADGITTYVYRGLEAGNYRCKASGSGYYTVTQNVYFSEEDAAGGRTIHVDPGKKAGIGFEQTSEIRLYTQEVLDNLLPDSANQWPGYESIFTTPFFSGDRPVHQQTTQQEMMDFLYSLDDPDDQMFIYILGTSPTRNYEIPIVLFTATDLSAAETLEEAAVLIRENQRSTIGYESQIHANEPASGEACLAMIQSLDGAYGNKVLESVNVYCIPRINPDGSYAFQRYNTAQNIDMNRDYLLSRSAEVVLVHRAYNLFLPEIIISGHEFYAGGVNNTTGVLDDVQVGTAAHLNSDAVVNDIAQEMVLQAFDDVSALGIRPFFYEGGVKYLSTKNNTIGRTYSGLLGSLSFLIESNGLGSGLAWFPRRVMAQYAVAESLIDYVAANSAKIREEVARAREKIIEKGTVYGEEADEIVLSHGSSNTPLYVPRPTWNLTDGTSQNANATSYIYFYDVALRTRTRPTAYVIPARETWTEQVLEVLDKNGIRYYSLPSGTSVLLQQYMGNSEEAILTEETAVTFENGAIVIPMNQVAGNVIAVLMEPDVTDTTGFNGTLLQSGIVTPDETGRIPIYRYIHDLEDCKIQATVPHQHTYKSTVTAPTCTEQGYTTYTCDCGDSYVDSWVEANGHSYGDWTETKAPTCTEAGEEKRECTNCDHFETRAVAAKGHSYQAVVTAPTCTEQGYTTYTCDCGDSYVDSWVEANGHSYGDWTETKAPTCTEKGEEKRECTNCDHFETRAVAAKGHSYQAVVTAPTCTEQGYTTHACTKCGDSYVDTYVAATGHSFCEWTETKAPTCTEKGEDKRECANCDHYETREVAEKGHNYKSGLCTLCSHDSVEFTVNNGILTVTCENMEPDTVIWLVAYDDNGRFAAMKRVTLDEALTLPAGERYVLFFVGENWMPLRKQLDL